MISNESCFVFFSFVWFARKGALWSNFEVTMSTSTRYNLEFTNMTGWKTTMNIIWVDVSTLLKNGLFPRQPSQFFWWVVDHQESEVEAEPEVTEVTVLPTAAGTVEPRQKSFFSSTEVTVNINASMTLLYRSSIQSRTLDPRVFRLFFLFRWTFFFWKNYKMYF